MTTPIGVTFREVMSGGLTLGETDCTTGEQKGDDAGTRFSMHGTITIDDLDRFIDDREHPGKLEGSVDYPALGIGLPSTSGIFNLFSPTDDPKMKYMVYEMGFVSNGQPYYMAGHKNVHDDPGIDFWRDVTTLYTTIHKGTDKTGPVAGAGILSLSLNQLRKLAGTITVTGTTSVSQKGAALAKFGSFFLGQMWETYIVGKFGGK